MIFQKKGMWKHPLSSKKFNSEQEAWDDYNLLYAEEIVLEALPEEDPCPVCEDEECECEEEDLSPLENLWKSADPT